MKYEGSPFTMPRSVGQAKLGKTSVDEETPKTKFLERSESLNLLTICKLFCNSVQQPADGSVGLAGRRGG